jgi:hypothetical protein
VTDSSVHPPIRRLHRHLLVLPIGRTVVIHKATVLRIGMANSALVE